MARETTQMIRVRARCTPETMDAVRRAAEIRGQSLSDFVAEAAHNAANEALEGADIIPPSRDDPRVGQDRLAKQSD